MTLSKEILGLAILTLITVVLVKGPILSRWELFRDLGAQVLPAENSDTVQNKYSLDLVQAKLTLARKQLDELRPAIPNQPFAFVKTLQDLSAEHGCVLSNWEEAADSRWQADLSGSAAALTELLFELESAMPAIDLEHATLAYREKSLWLFLHVRFPEETPKTEAIPLEGGTHGSNQP